MCVLSVCCVCAVCVCVLTFGCVCAETEKDDKEEGKEAQGGKWLGVFVCLFVMCDCYC